MDLKLKFLICTTLINVNFLKCQVIDKCVLKCTYEFALQKDSTNKSLINTELMALDIGEKSSLFYSEKRKGGDSLKVEDEKHGLLSASNQNNGKYNQNNWSIIISKNYPTNQVSVSENLLFPYLYKECLVTQKWVLLKDTASINGLQCKKAITTFRGRQFEAWYTKSIPTNHGPWKFYGLPGLIVKVNDLKNQFVFTLVNVINTAGLDIKIIFPENKYIPIKRLQLQKLKQEMADDPITFIENNTPYHIKFPQTPTERKAKRGFYNPIELF